MTVRTIVTYPDQRLFKPSEIVDVSQRNEEGMQNLRALAQDLFETMRDASGVGITAPHIGVLKRIVVLSLPEGDASSGAIAGVDGNDDLGASEYQVYLNPEIIEASSDTVQFEEGSISMPGVVEKIVRSARVTVRYVNLDGTTQIEEAHGFRAVCHQHEIDQLNGVFWTEKLSRLKRERVVTRFLKLRRGA